VAWRHNPLVSRDCSEAGSVAAEPCGGEPHPLSKQECFSCTGHLATLFCVYDSLIEKCSTLSRPSASSGVGCLLLIKLSV
jgi:hypothetical protein